MISEIPVIASDVDGISEIVIEGKTGYLVAPGNTEEMAEKVIAVLRNEHVARRITATARLNLEEFTVQNMLKEYSQLYENTLAGI